LLCAALAPPLAAADEADAKRLLKAMSDYLAAQKAISFDFDSSLDLVSAQQQKMTLAASGSVVMNRPDKLRVSRRGGFANMEMSFDGKTVTLLGKNSNMVARSRRPAASASWDRPSMRPSAPACRMRPVSWPRPRRSSDAR